LFSFCFFISQSETSILLFPFVVSLIFTFLEEILQDNLEESVERVKIAKEENEYYDEDDEKKFNSRNDIITLEDSQQKGLKNDETSTSSAAASQQLIAFESPANDYFQTRTFQGLKEFVTKEDIEEDDEKQAGGVDGVDGKTEQKKTKIYNGQVGIASSYQQIISDVNPSSQNKVVLKDIEDM
jgi:hypothetical protein